MWAEHRSRARSDARLLQQAAQPLPVDILAADGIVLAAMIRANPDQTNRVFGSGGVRGLRWRSATPTLSEGSRDAESCDVEWCGACSGSWWSFELG